MSEILIVGDDLTGVNGAATGMTRRGLTAVTLRVGERADVITEHRGSYDAVAVTTDSRHAPAAEAVRRTAAAVTAAWPVRFVSSRCDSTLRGNVGAQAQAAIETVRELAGHGEAGRGQAGRGQAGRGQAGGLTDVPEVIGLCMPAFPSADRQTVDGLQLMGGVRLEHTELARDVRTPMTSSSVEDALSADSSLRCAHIGLTHVTEGGRALEAEIARLLEEAPDVLIGDALTQAHLDEVARAALAVRPDALWVGIDPGPGSWAIVEAMGLTRTSTSNSNSSASAPPLLAVSGSATELTRTQLKDLIPRWNAVTVRPIYLPGTQLVDVEATASAVLTAAHSGPELIVLATVLEDADLIAGEEKDQIPNALGAVTARVLASVQVAGLYTTGGDITAAVLEHLGAAGMAIRSEVVPLATSGTLVGGPHAGTPIVTKGGMVGGQDTAHICVEALAELAQNGRTRHDSTCPRTHSR